MILTWALSLDKSVRRHLTPTEEDWDIQILKEMAVFFEATYQYSSDNYSTLRNTIPKLPSSIMISQLNVYA